MWKCRPRDVERYSRWTLTESEGGATHGDVNVLTDDYIKRIVLRTHVNATAPSTRLNAALKDGTCSIAYKFRVKYECPRISRIVSYPVSPLRIQSAAPARRVWEVVSVVDREARFKKSHVVAADA
ncbi:hypothetical protein EVAR_60554_1 [Eumeta japonica]|uniref:Uncharacterized protein n=1 Tax=Eumeta variegata TaxID=151549 RepID=A0A4C1YJ91_EUMVA|nr:hypothetical protein EVAR_60554_1 [Eumeta japonica]